ncbi:Adenosine 5'-monophosphoramidase [Exserohilum turcicum]
MAHQRKARQKLPHLIRPTPPHFARKLSLPCVILENSRTNRQTNQPTSQSPSTTMSSASCIFCKIIKGEIPSMKIFESDNTLAFLDIGPLSKGHSLIIPKYHGAKLHDIPDDQLAEVVSVTKRIAVAQNLQDYNILQNNGRIAHQMVDHVHFHLIPKPNEQEGLGVGWPTKEADKGELSKLLEEIKSKM